MKPNKKSIGYIVGYVLGSLIFICIAACIGSLVLAAAIKFITWIFAFV